MGKTGLIFWVIVAFMALIPITAIVYGATFFLAKHIIFTIVTVLGLKKIIALIIVLLFLDFTSTWKEDDARFRY